MNLVPYLIKERHLKLDDRTAEGGTPLHFASRSGAIDVVRHFVEQHRMKADERTYEGATALHFAAKSDVEDLVNYFLEKHALKKNDLNRGWWSPLTYAPNDEEWGVAK